MKVGGLTSDSKCCGGGGGAENTSSSVTLYNFQKNGGGGGGLKPPSPSPSAGPEASDYVLEPCLLISEQSLLATSILANEYLVA